MSDARADRIADPWGERTPYGAGEPWPVRVDVRLADGVTEDEVERWVPAASILHSNGDGLDIVALAVPGGVLPQLASRVTARARQRGAVLIVMGAWPGADVSLDVLRGAWHGLGQGVGRLRRREIEVHACGRGAAARSRRVRLWLPGSSGAAMEIPSINIEDYRSGEERRRAS